LREVQSLDLNLLPVAQALLAERSVTRAAARLHLSVPATSRALDRCRISFDDPLLVRSGRGLQITPRGAELLPAIEEALAAVSRTVQRPAELVPEQLRATFTVRANEVIQAILAGTWLEVIVERAPGVRLRFEVESSDDIDALRRGDISFAVGSYGGLTDDLHRHPLVEEPLVGVMRAGHPMAGTRITAKRFASLRHVVTSRRGIARGPVDELLGQSGLRRDVAAVVPSFAAAIGMCLTSDLTTLAPQRFVAVLGGDRTLASYVPPVALPVVQVDLVWHARHHQDPPHRWLRQTLEEAVQRVTQRGFTEPGRGGGRR
jgi:DNA-binding transcriptional LysR family regulator